jgi:hypothetical protein
MTSGSLGLSGQCFRHPSASRGPPRLIGALAGVFYPCVNKALAKAQQKVEARATGRPFGPARRAACRPNSGNVPTAPVRLWPVRATLGRHTAQRAMPLRLRQEIQALPHGRV